MGLKLKNLHSWGNHQENEKTAYWMVKDICNDLSDKALTAKIYKDLL